MRNTKPTAETAQLPEVPRFSKPLARLVIRGDNKKDGGMLAVLMKSNDYFKPKHVYEIMEIFGEIVVIEVGPSWIPNESQTGPNWGHKLSELTHNHNGLTFLAKKEFDEICQQGNPYEISRKLKKKRKK